MGVRDVNSPVNNSILTAPSARDEARGRSPIEQRLRGDVPLPPMVDDFILGEQNTIPQNLPDDIQVQMNAIGMNIEGGTNIPTGMHAGGRTKSWPFKDNETCSNRRASPSQCRDNETRSEEIATAQM